jgi:hypothetical protein
MITFRLTSDEYEKCREVCFSRGISSVSDMARTGIKLLIQQPDRVGPQALETRVSDLESRFRLLLLEFRRMNQTSESQDCTEPQLLSPSMKAQ